MVTLFGNDLPRKGRNPLTGQTIIPPLSPQQQSVARIHIHIFSKSSHNEVFAPPFSALALLSLWRHRACKISPGQGAFINDTSTAVALEATSPDLELHTWYYTYDVHNSSPPSTNTQVTLIVSQSSQASCPLQYETTSYFTISKCRSRYTTGTHGLRTEYCYFSRARGPSENYRAVLAAVSSRVSAHGSLLYAIKPPPGSQVTCTTGVKTENTVGTHLLYCCCTYYCITTLRYPAPSSHAMQGGGAIEQIRQKNSNPTTSAVQQSSISLLLLHYFTQNVMNMFVGVALFGLLPRIIKYDHSPHTTRPPAVMFMKTRHEKMGGGGG